MGKILAVVGVAPVAILNYKLLTRAPTTFRFFIYY